MKKLFTSLVLLMIGVVATYAANYDLYVAGTRVTSSNAGNIKTGISYDASSKTLTLNNCTLNAGSNYAIRNTGIAGLKIRVLGTCTVTSSTDVFVFHKNTVVAGDLNNAGATLTASTTGDNAAVFWAEDESEMCIYNLYLTATGKQYCIYGYNYDEGAKYSKLYMSCVKMTATVSSGSIGAVAGFLSASFDEGDAYLVEGAYNTTKKAVCASSSSTTPLNTVETSGGLYLGGIIVRVGLEATKLSPSGLSKGTISYDGQKTLTLDGVTYNDSKRFIDNYKINNLKVVVKGTNTVSTSGYAIFSRLSYSIEGATSSYTANKLTVSKSFGPVTLWMTDYSGNSTITLKNLTLDVKGTDVGISGQANSGVTFTRDLVIDNCKITTEVTEKTSTSAIRGFNTCTLTGVDVKSPNYSWFRAAKKEFQNASGFASNPVEIDVPTTWYPIKVLGYRISNLNTNAFGREGMTGTITWNNSTSTLTLNHVTLKASGDERGIEVGASLASDLIVKFVEENNVTTSNDAFYMGKNTTFTGSGQAVFTSTSETGLSGVGGACPTFTTEGVVQFKGKKYGYWGTGSSKEVMTIKKTSDSPYVRFTGETAAIHNLTDLTLDKVDFATNSATSTNLHGCYFDKDSKTVKQNGGTVAKGTVAFGYVTTSYGILVAGTPVNNCNMFGVGSPYITAGGAQAVTYDKSSKTLTLDGATIDPGTTSCCIMSYTDLTIDVKGNCTLKKPSGKTTTYLDGNTTIKGSGNLTVEGELWAIGDGTTLKLDDVNIKADQIDASNTNSVTLDVDLKTAGKRIEVEKWGVTDFVSLKLNTSKIIEPDGGKYDATQKCVVDASGTKAKKVIFGDKTATGIEGIEADTDAEVIGIYDAQGRKLDEMQLGINIIRMSNGTTRKVVK